MKTKTIIATALLTAGLGTGAASTTVNAASWHKGTPSATKGYWHNDSIIYHVHSNVILFKLRGSQSLHDYRHTSYKRTSRNHYTIRALSPQTGTHLNIRFRTFGNHANKMIVFGSYVYRGK